MLHIIQNSYFFGLSITFACWATAVWICSKKNHVLLNPLLVGSILLTFLIVIFKIPLDVYTQSTTSISNMVGPLTTILAFNIYKQQQVLKENFVVVVVSCTVGCLVSVASTLAIGYMMMANNVIIQSLISKNVTTAIAISISENRGGIVGITVASVMVAGLIGAILSPLLVKVFGIKEPVAQGLAIGATSHALGTSRAITMGEIQGAMSSISLCVSGIVTAIIVIFI
ncbi:hypothetical protein AN396_11115 [Candidatus Epulonipiscium fishelsonii]|uniref:Uncharacterized protein n=1 Tax=Candidatus Epulonipiscium fishelsonii TaxID=77094 RepID=A0ACC8X8D5_9FIRM|nr:hypothetical protein AN396_11115 [Epulopiscium sp. SCG-B11WGA-EpuloA1]